MGRLGYLGAAAYLLACVVSPASADTIANFTLDGVTFDDGGTATGGFTLDLTTGTLSNVNITTSYDPVAGPFGFGATFNDGSSNTFTNGATATFDFFVDLFFVADGLDIDVAGPLTAANLMGNPSFPISGSETFYFIECGDGPCATRNITAGSLDVSSTPLPAALPLFAGGLGALGLFGWRKKRKAIAA